MKSTYTILILFLLLLEGTSFAQDAYSALDAPIPTPYTPVSIDTTELLLYTCAGDYLSYADQQIKAGKEALVTLRAQNGQDSLVRVQVKAYPEVSFELYSSETCWNEDAGSIDIQNVRGGLGPYTFSLDKRRFQQTPQFDYLGAGEYRVYARDAYQCVYKTSIEIPMKEPLEVRAEDRVLACHSDSLNLVPDVISGKSDQIKYRWSDGSRDSVLVVDQAGIYWVEISNSCETVKEEIWVGLGEQDRSEKSYIYMPNAFSPNSDGYNDQYRGYPASGVQVLSYELHLYDRRGNQVFETFDITKGWDGLYKTEMAEPDAYLFYMKAKVVYCRREMEVFDEGNVTLLRNGTR